jgi:hypothetical protein
VRAILDDLPPESQVFCPFSSDTIRIIDDALKDFIEEEKE